MNSGQREVVLSHRYLNLPVKAGAAVRTVSVSVDGVPVRRFEIELADEKPDFWVFVDMADWRGKTATITVDGAPDGSGGLSAVECSDEIRGDEVYSEKLRPLFHFTSRRGWLNDPNGLVYYEGEYHLFYQHNPYGTQWGNMHWGHAVSTDLLHWKELPEALYPLTMAKGHCFSGSAVVDESNTSGFGAGDEKPLVALFTDTGCGEAVSYSNDRGRTWTCAPGNPVIQHTGRDPKVFWYGPGKHWALALYDVQDGKDGIAFFTSPDLRKWTRESWTGGYFECPDIFALPVDGDEKLTRWVLSAADGWYQIGGFDGKTFTPETEKIRYHHGNCYYAAQSFNGIPEADGRRIQIAWGQNAVTPGMPFNQCMLVPVSLTLHSTEAGPRLRPHPVREIESLRTNGQEFRSIRLDAEHPKTVNCKAESLDVLAEFSIGGASEMTFAVRGVPVVYDADKQALSCQGCTGPLKPRDGKVRLRILVDRSTIEVFGNDGELYMPVAVLPDPADRTVTVSRGGTGKAEIERLDVYELRSVWE